jgi:hypothetical protein
MDEKKRINFLVTEAAKKFNSEAELARHLGDNRMNVNHWKNGTRTCPPEQQIIMGALIGIGADQVMRDFILEKHHGTEKGQKLLDAFSQKITKVMERCAAEMRPLQ